MDHTNRNTPTKDMLMFEIKGQSSLHSMWNRKLHTRRPYQRSRSSPVRFSNIYGACMEIAYYSVHPPSTPLYLLPFPLSALSTPAYCLSQQQPITRYKKESKKIVRHVLRLILRSVTKVIVSDASVNTKDVSVGSSVRTMSQSIAIQTEHKVLVKRYVDDEDVNSSSVASCIELETKWRKDFRSLRDSHVRLVLRQLRQLQDIERLSRVLCCTHSPGTSTSSCQIDLTEY